MRRELRDEGSKVRTKEFRRSGWLIRLLFQVNKDYKLVLLTKRGA